MLYLVFPLRSLHFGNQPISEAKKYTEKHTEKQHLHA